MIDFEVIDFKQDVLPTQSIFNIPPNNMTKSPPVNDPPEVKQPNESSEILTSKKMLADYQLIGKSLLICEAANIFIGNPLIFPTKRVKQYNDLFNGNTEEFIRLGLVEVNTETLNSYCDDLNPSSANANDNFLAIPTPPRWERYLFPVLISFVAGAASLLGISTLNSLNNFAVTTSIIITVLVGSFCSNLGSEPHRRASFALLLSKEIMRRTGTPYDNNSNRINIYQTGIKASDR